MDRNRFQYSSTNSPTHLRLRLLSPRLPHRHPSRRASPRRTSTRHEIRRQRALGVHGASGSDENRRGTFAEGVYDYDVCVVRVCESQFVGCDRCCGCVGTVEGKDGDEDCAFGVAVWVFDNDADGRYCVSFLVFLLDLGNVGADADVAFVARC